MMRESAGTGPHARALLFSTLVTLGVFAAHHVYGAVRYATPWRHHAAAVALVMGAALVAAFAAHRRRPGERVGRVAGWMLVALAAALVLGVGLFEGLYNHVAKDVLFLSGAPRTALTTLFPPPRYEMPNDALFEISGVLQVVPVAFSARAAARLARSLRAGGRRRGDPGAEAAPQPS